MRIALIGYGKMGKAIEEIALAKGYEIVLKISSANTHDFIPDNIKKADMAIEFSNPEVAPDNICRCVEAGIPVVSGSTGWLKDWDNVAAYIESQDGSFLYGSNYSIGVNLFFELNKSLAKLMNSYSDYNVSMEEIHHTQKKDAPSGTAITLAEQILEEIKTKKNWVNEPSGNKEDLVIISKREDPAPGTHIIKYTSDIDDIEIVHTAHNRKGFAGGVVLAAEFLLGKKGIYTMKDVLFN